MWFVAFESLCSDIVVEIELVADATVFTDTSSNIKVNPGTLAETWGVPATTTSYVPIRGNT